MREWAWGYLGRAFIPEAKVGLCIHSRAWESVWLGTKSKGNEEQEVRSERLYHISLDKDFGFSGQCYSPLGWQFFPYVSDFPYPAWCSPEFRVDSTE